MAVIRPGEDVSHWLDQALEEIESRLGKTFIDLLFAKKEVSQLEDKVDYLEAQKALLIKLRRRVVVREDGVGED